MSTRVLIVDDQALVRAGFRLVLESQPDLDVVGEASDGEEAVAAARRLDPDVVLMDVRMPHMDGIEATRRILEGESSAAVRIIMLTTFDLDEYVYSAIVVGACGFLLKDVTPDQLIAAVRTVKAGDALLAPSITRRLIERYAARRAPNPGLDALTEREADVLRLMARGLGNQEIAEKLFVSEATVKTHVAHILDKLHVENRVQAVVAAYESGLVAPGG